MSISNERDPRTVLVKDKFFSLRPKPLERWLWQQGLPQAAERVFWLHWEEGMKRGDWCSELALRQVARECFIDTSTVTRAYQLLKGLDLIRRADPGRNPSNPFQQAVAITEVRVPRGLLIELSRAPNRGAKREPRHLPAEAAIPPSAQPSFRAPDAIDPPEDRPVSAVRPKISRAQAAALMGCLSASERAAFFVASRDRRREMTFDHESQLQPDDKTAVLELLASISSAQPTAAPTTTVPQTLSPVVRDRQLSALEAARLRKGVCDLVSVTEAPEIFRQVLWSVEEGALRRFELRLAINTALKKIREGTWSRPNRMPPQWLRSAQREACSAA